jgi:Holliday junction resolvase RusA-like endonuclease
MTALHFTILGRPQTAGSKNAFPHRTTGRIVVVPSNREQQNWQAAVREAAARACDGHRLLDGPLRLSVTFYLRRPAGHFGSGRNAGEVRPSAPAFPAVKPDLSKLTRALEDAMIGVAIADDARFVAIYAAKRYGAPERAEVLVRPVTEGAL